MTEEKRLNKYIEDHCGTKALSPFKVPKGYFDTLPDRLMNQLPEQTRKREKKAKTIRLTTHVWHMTAAAVIVIGLIIGSVTMLPDRIEGRQMTEDTQQGQTISTAETDEAYLNDVLDYAMVDNSEIEDYLTEE